MQTLASPLLFGTPTPKSLYATSRAIKCCSSSKPFKKQEEGGAMNKPPAGKQGSIFDQIFKNRIRSIEPVELLGDVSPNLVFNLPAMLVLLGKELVSGMVTTFLSFLRKHVEFVIRPGAEDGLDLGIRWHIEWKGKDLHLGSACRLDTSHTYYGKIILLNGKALIHPLGWKPSKLIDKENLGMVKIYLEKMANHFILVDKTKLLGSFSLMFYLVFMAVTSIVKNKTN